MVPDLTTWLLVFLRMSAFVAVFPIFSATHFPPRIRVALAFFLSLMVMTVVPSVRLAGDSVWSAVGVMTAEVVAGLMLGYVSRLVFYALDLAGGFISSEIGLTTPGVMNPLTQSQGTDTGAILYYLGAILWLGLDLHHQLFLALQHSYALLPMGGVGVSEGLAWDITRRTAGLLVIAIQVSAPMVSVAFVVNLVFAMLGRAVPQMNVFSESFAVRIVSGLVVFGMTCEIMGQHLSNYLRRLPGDVLRVAELMRGG